ncbi:sialic acid O-acetyltransferase NeuD family sugar O-acyltransferase [Bacillus cereus VD196]|uniref:Sialic acid O-acetyltransferase NeuD family sugar O-acyltransferase n=1 Tax=Bacillus cereus VD196 TaxID=1053243 RepID=A0A9W5PYF3_BACCE|nr:acetyltransferase [Bacillus cereus]EJR90593.1 sialic acid O-acetyltransferase NeuD family sugar O-acyltransferase [Bacillus cereus VD200]EOO60742.1 sialic acid O-acetyltransferase NeuD family sugar O-acyltransferase [Bacillus cereus VD196]
MINIIIIGINGFGREIYQYAKDTFPSDQYEIKGFLSSNTDDSSNSSTVLKILGDENSYEIQENDRFILAIGDVMTKKRIVSILKKKGAKFINLIHPTAIVFDTAMLGEGVVICPNVIVSDQAVIEDFVTMNCYSTARHDSRIGKYSILAPYTIVNGYSILENEIFLGTHSTVIAETKIGRNSKISANSVAMYNVAPYSFVYGVPGKSKKIFG